MCIRDSSYVDIYLPEDASIYATTETATRANEIVREVADDYGKAKGKHDKGHEILKSVTTFVGGGAPRFWYSLAPQQRQLNYAQLVIEVSDDHDTSQLIGPLQQALTSRVPGARMDVRQLENGKPVPNPVEIRISGSDTVSYTHLTLPTSDLV